MTYELGSIILAFVAFAGFWTRWEHRMTVLEDAIKGNEKRLTAVELEVHAIEQRI